MQMKHITVSAISVVFLLVVGAALIRPIRNDDRSNFEDTQRVAIAGSVHQSDHLPFDWSVYEDPSNPEFWDDGDGAPPRPLRHLAAHPTKENARRVLEWLKKQHEVIAKVAEVMGESGIPMEALLSSQQAAKGHSEIKLASFEAVPELPQESLDGVRIINIYRSTCPACQRAQSTIAALKAAGAQIMNIQTDYGKIDPLYEDSQEYDKELAQHFPHDVTPTLYVKVDGKEPEMIEGDVDFAALNKHLIDLLKGGDGDAKQN